MLNYCIKRILHIIPILFGVLLLTFVLFHVVGGSPAAFVLGKNASAQALDEFDRQFGYDQPLFWGKWLRSRALDLQSLSGESQDSDIARSDLRELRFNYPLKNGKRYILQLEFDKKSPKSPFSLRFSKKNDGKDCFLSKNGVFSPDFVEFSCSQQEGPVDAIFLDFTQEDHPGIEKAELFEESDHMVNSQFLDYLVRLIHFDFGVSAETNQRVVDILKQGAGPSLALNIPILVGGVLVGVVLALLCAWQRGQWFDRISVVTATALMSVNYIVWIVAGQYLFAYRLGWFPIWGFESWRYLLLPVLIGIVTGLGRDVRFYRTVMLDEMYCDYVRTAEAKGVSTSGILFKHVLRNALVPVVTNISLSLPFLFTGSLLLESFFGIPGLGGISVNAINSSDMAVVQAVVLIGALLYVVINLVTDLLYGLIDPRVRLE